MAIPLPRVGDAFFHPVHGEGKVKSVGNGQVEVRSFAGPAIILFGDSLERIKPDGMSRYRLLTQQEADIYYQTELQKRKRLRQLHEIFEKDFLQAFSYKNELDISNDEITEEAIGFVRAWINKHTIVNTTIDDDQAQSIASVNGDFQVVARAGSGKTSTLVNRAFFLQKHCGVKPSEMMLLAFNKDAAKEIEARLGKLLQDSPPYVMTFHALAHALLSPVTFGLIYDNAYDSFVQDVIDNYLRDPEFYGCIRKVMLEHFKEDWDRIEQGGYHLSPEQLLAYRRSLQRETLRGEFVKSYGEKLIANILFEHQIPYLYEPLEKGWLQNYHPDFLIAGKDKCGIAIEYFGMVGDPDYDAMSEEKRRYWSYKPGWLLIELTPSDIEDGALRPKVISKLMETFRQRGFPCDRMSEIEIWQQVSKRAIDRFSMVTRNLIARCRKLELTPGELWTRIRQHRTKWQVEKDFLEIAVPIYRDYLESLEAQNKEDFDGLMHRAIDAIRSGKTSFSRNKGQQQGNLEKLRFILIDEYQDFSKLFHSMIEAIRETNPDVQMFCVGDDWQAINGFAGSDLRYHNKFIEYFPDARRLHLSMNYRSAAGIVAAGNAVMAVFDPSGKPATSHSQAKGKVWIADIDEFSLSTAEQNLHGDDRITPMVLRLAAQAIEKDRDIVMLSRTNNAPRGVRFNAYQGDASKTDFIGLGGFLKLVRSFFPDHQRHRIKASSVHSFKGLQGNTVVLLDAVAGCYPLIHQDWIFLQVLGESVGKITDEERRLFYVALTRAVDTLAIFTTKHKKSPFLEDVEKHLPLMPLPWNMLPPVAVGPEHLAVMVGNYLWDELHDPTPTMTIKAMLMQDNYKYRSGIWPCYVKGHAAEGFAIQSLQAAAWAQGADGVEVRILDGRNKMVGNYLIHHGQWEVQIEYVSASNADVDET